MVGFHRWRFIPPYSGRTNTTDLVTAGTPPAIINKLQAETVKAVKAPDFSERLAREGSDGVASTPDQFAAVIKIEMAKWADVVRRSGMQPE